MTLPSTSLLSQGAIDLRPVLPSIRDQGERDTCTSFAVTAAHESYMQCTKDLSAEWFFWACKQIDKGRFDQGVLMDVLPEVLLLTGQPEEAFWPYNPGLVVNRGQAYSPPSGSPLLYKANLVQSPYSDTNLYAELNNNRPVLLSVNVGSNFVRYKSQTILENPDHNLTFVHALLVVGWDGESWILRNSWGQRWGDAGHAKCSPGWLAQSIRDGIFWSIQ